MAGGIAPPLTSDMTSGRQEPMRKPQFIHSNTFHWALTVAAVFAIFVIVLFGFIYWKTDDYLVARSDKMIARQLDFISALPGDRRIAAIDQHLGEDSRGVQYAGLFDADGRKLGRNLGHFPSDLKMDDSVRGVAVVRMFPSGTAAAGDPCDRPAHAERRRAGHRAREVDEAREISHVVGQALGLGLLPAFLLCLMAGAWLSMRAQKRVEEV